MAWAELSHAYGVADDVPDLLRRMAGSDEVDVVTAQEELRGSILHQGGVCTATVPAVPFLGTLLADPATVHPGGIVHLLGDMADIRDPGLADLRAAVTAEVDRILPFLTADDAYTRQVAAFALAQCPGRAAETIPALRAQWTVEPEPAVRGSLVIAVVTLDPGTDLLTEALAATEPAVRAGAAIAAGRAGRWSADAVDAVRAGWAEGDPWLDRDSAEIGYPWDWDPIDDLVAHADQPPTVAALLASGDPAVREKAAQLGGAAAGESRAMRAPMAAALTPALADPEPRVRAAAAWAVRRAGALPDAFVALACEDTGEARNIALAALVEHDDPRARDLLPAEAAGTHPGSAVDAAGDLYDPGVVELLAELGDRRQLPRLRARLASEPGVSRYDQGRHVAIARLVWQWTGETETPLRAARSVMADGSPAPRAEAADLAAELGDPDAVDTLRAVLTEHDRWARLLAAQALWRHTGVAEVSTLTDILTSRPNEHVLRKALDVLASFGVEARPAIPTLRALATQDATVYYYGADDNVAARDEALRAAILAVIALSAT